LVEVDQAKDTWYEHSMLMLLNLFQKFDHLNFDSLSKKRFDSIPFRIGLQFGIQTCNLRWYYMSYQGSK